MSIKVYCPSYKRSDLAISHKLFAPENFCYVVREFEVEKYRKFGVPILTIPDEAGVTNISETRNWILENRESELVVMVDDDMSRFFVNEKRERKVLSVEEIWDLILKGFQMAYDCGAGMWGINCQTDPRFYQQHRPFCFSNIVLGPFVGLLDCDIRYDETMPLKEDYDLFIQHMKKHRKVFRFNMYSYECNHQTLPGGCSEIRNEEEERRQFALLQKKWGSEIVKRNWKAPGSINPILKIPV